MTLEEQFDSTSDSAPTLSQLVHDAAVIPIEVVQREEYRDQLPSIGDIASALPQEFAPASDAAATVPLPPRYRAGGRRRWRRTLHASVAAFGLVTSAGVALAAWMIPPPMGPAPAVPTVAEPAKLVVDTKALSLAVSAEALRRLSPAPAQPTAAPEPQAPTRAPAASTPEAVPTVEFDPAAARMALDRAAASAGSCRSGDDPSGVARAIVTFAPSGRVTSATVNGPPFAGTATGGCIARALRVTTVPPFDGRHVTVAKTVVIH
jgi:hypothetical protein